jgi:hypothetical protein
MTGSVERRRPEGGTTTEELVAKIYHTDGRVNAIEGKLDDQGMQLNRIENAILNKQPAWNNATVMALVLAVGAFLVGITGYVDLQLDPITARQTEDMHWKRDKDEFQRATHYRYGEMDTWTKDYAEKFAHHDELYHLLDERVRELEGSHHEGTGMLRERGRTMDRDARELQGIRQKLGDHLEEGHLR